MVTFSDNSPPNLAEEHKEQLIHTLAPNHPSAIVSRDLPWVKLVAHNIPTEMITTNHEPKKAYSKP
jgi:hypothetical protein